MHELLDKTVAEFVGMEDAITFGMGFATNSTTIPALADQVLNRRVPLRCFLHRF